MVNTTIRIAMGRNWNKWSCLGLVGEKGLTAMKAMAYVKKNAFVLRVTRNFGMGRVNTHHTNENSHNGQ